MFWHQCVLPSNCKKNGQKSIKIEISSLQEQKSMPHLLNCHLDGMFWHQCVLQSNCKMEIFLCPHCSSSKNQFHLLKCYFDEMFWRQYVLRQILKWKNLDVLFIVKKLMSFCKSPLKGMLWHQCALPSNCKMIEQKNQWKTKMSS